MLIEQTKEKLYTLKLTGMLEAFDQQRSQPQTHELSFEERLGLLVDREMIYRENKRLERLLRGRKITHQRLY